MREPNPTAETVQPPPSTLVFEPYFRPQVWGGRRFERVLHKSLPSSEAPIGESWELSGHPQHVSRVADGPWQGRSINEIWRGQLASGTPPPGTADSERFPVLVKFLDCHEPLSVQVHPTSVQAQRYGVDTTGKTEAWIVLHADPGSFLYAGWRPGINRAAVEQHLKTGKLTEALHRIAPQPGDCYEIPAGTVHAIGGGLLLLEVQQCSDATFRLFDWNRATHQGQPRTLHIEEALECMDWSRGPIIRQAELPWSDPPEGTSGHSLVENAHFRLDRFEIVGESCTFPATDIAIWVLLEGTARLLSDGDAARALTAGQTIVTLPTAGHVRWERASTEPTRVVRISLPTPSNA